MLNFLLLKYYKSEKDRFEKLFKNKTITKSKLEKAFLIMINHILK